MPLFSIRKSAVSEMKYQSLSAMSRLVVGSGWLLVFGELFFGYILEFLDTKGLILDNILDIILVSHVLAILNESAISSKLNCCVPAYRVYNSLTRQFSSSK